MKRRKQLTFEATWSEEEAQALVARINSGYTKYTRKKNPARYELVHDQYGKEVWLVIFYKYW